MVVLVEIAQAGIRCRGCAWVYRRIEHLRSILFFCFASLPGVFLPLPLLIPRLLHMQIGGKTMIHRYPSITWYRIWCIPWCRMSATAQCTMTLMASSPSPCPSNQPSTCNERHWHDESGSMRHDGYIGQRRVGKEGRIMRHGAQVEGRS